MKRRIPLELISSRREMISHTSEQKEKTEGKEEKVEKKRNAINIGQNPQSEKGESLQTHTKKNQPQAT